MNSLFTNLLFLHGHIADPALARRLAEEPKPTPRAKGKRGRTPAAMPVRKPLGAPALATGGCG